MSKKVNNLTVKEKIISHEIQSIYNSAVNQRCTNLQADNILCNTISYVNGTSGGGEITSTQISQNTYTINSIDYTYYFLTYDGVELIEITLNNLNDSQLGKVFYIFYRSDVGEGNKNIYFYCGSNSYILRNQTFNAGSVNLLSNKYNQITAVDITLAGNSKNTLFKFTPIINDGITYYYLDEYYS